MNESARYTTEATKSQEEIGKIELKIASESKKIVEDQRRLDQEIDLENKQLVEQKSSWNPNTCE